MSDLARERRELSASDSGRSAGRPAAPPRQWWFVYPHTWDRELAIERCRAWGRQDERADALLRLGPVERGHAAGCEVSLASKCEREHLSWPSTAVVYRHVAVGASFSHWRVSRHRSRSSCRSPSGSARRRGSAARVCAGPRSANCGTLARHRQALPARATTASGTASRSCAWTHRGASSARRPGQRCRRRGQRNGPLHGGTNGLSGPEHQRA